MSGSADFDSGAEPEDLNVLGEPLRPCGAGVVTGFYRDGSCRSGPEDVGSHTVCAIMTADFLEQQMHIGNDLITPRPERQFPGLMPGDCWCVVALRWWQSNVDGVAPPVLLASTNARALELIPLQVLRGHAVDVPPDLSSIE